MALNYTENTYIALEEVVSDFLLRQSHYASRNYVLDLRQGLYEGKHWSEDTTESDTQFQLVINYTRNIVLRFTALLSRRPKPSVPLRGNPNSPEGIAANAKEKLLLILWPELMRAWGDVEINASKYSYGVFQALWSPDPNQPEQVKVGQGEDTTSSRRYTKSPFKFRSIPPHLFYPVFRTFDHSNDFYAVFRFDPGRLIKDLEARYDVVLNVAGMPTQDGGTILEVEPSADLIEYWRDDVYVLIAMTTVVIDKRPESRRRMRANDVNLGTEQRYTVLEAGENPYGVIPFWVLQNIRSDPNEDPTVLGSLADLDDISGLTRHLEEILSEEAEEIVTNIHRPLVYQSEDHRQDPSNIGIIAGEVIPIGAEEQVSPLIWQGEPEIVPNHIQQIRRSLQDISFLGEAGFGQLAAGMSGVGFSIALSPMQQILELKLPLRKDALQSICGFILRCFEKKADSNAGLRGWVEDQYQRFDVATVSPEDIGRDHFVEIRYGNLLPRDDQAHEQNEVYKYKTGGQSLLTMLNNLGFDDPQAELGRIKAEQSDPILNPEKAALIQQLRAQQQPPQGAVQPGGGELPGTAQPSTRPVQEQGFGGLGGGVPPGAAPTGAPPPVPAPTQGGAGGGPGQLAPFLNRRTTGPNLAPLPGRSR